MARLAPLDIPENDPGRHGSRAGRPDLYPFGFTGLDGESQYQSRRVAINDFLQWDTMVNAPRAIFLSSPLPTPSTLPHLALAAFPQERPFLRHLRLQTGPATEHAV